MISSTRTLILSTYQYNHSIRIMNFLDNRLDDEGVRDLASALQDAAAKGTCKFQLNIHSLCSGCEHMKIHVTRPGERSTTRCCGTRYVQISVEHSLIMIWLWARGNTRHTIWWVLYKVLRHKVHAYWNNMLRAHHNTYSRLTRFSSSRGKRYVYRKGTFTVVKKVWYHLCCD